MGPINKKIKKSRKRYNSRNRALTKMREKTWSVSKPLIQGIYDMGKPYIRKTMQTLSDKGEKKLRKFTQGQRVPRVKNNPSWVGLRKAINQSFIDKNILSEEIDIAVYFQAIEVFLNKYKDVTILKEDINDASHTVRGRDIGSAMEGYMETTLEQVTIQSIVKVVEYLFSHKINPNDTDIDIDENPDKPRWSGVVEKKRLERLEKKVLVMEMSVDRISKLLFEATLPRDKSRYTSELNILLSKISDYIKNEAEDGILIHRIRDKCNALTLKHIKNGHKIKNHFNELMDLDYGSKKKVKKTKKIKRRKKRV